ncbi:hypothetical protein B0H12DRAFT_776110 [Mycena haematopus]|nr:hypothetical protein B0H12DRAFT_776110 [Mycena haematopus]
MRGSTAAKPPSCPSLWLSLAGSPHGAEERLFIRNFCAQQLNLLQFEFLEVLLARVQSERRNSWAGSSVFRADMKVRVELRGSADFLSGVLANNPWSPFMRKTNFLLLSMSWILANSVPDDR